MLWALVTRLIEKSTVWAGFPDESESDEKEFRKKLVSSESRIMSATVLHHEIGIISFDMTMYPFP